MRLPVRRGVGAVGAVVGTRAGIWAGTRTAAAFALARRPGVGARVGAQAAPQSETPADRASHKLPLSEVGSLPGLLQQDPAVWLRRSEEGDDTSRIQRMVEAHFASQTASDFGNACQIRAELDALEVTFEDYANGSAWRRTG